eukprot:UN1302
MARALVKGRSSEVGPDDGTNGQQVWVLLPRHVSVLQPMEPRLTPQLRAIGAVQVLNSFRVPFGKITPFPLHPAVEAHAAPLPAKSRHAEPLQDVGVVLPLLPVLLFLVLHHLPSHHMPRNALLVRVAVHPPVAECLSDSQGP